jgi:pyrroloquinoline quinone biosynthesis protein D
MCSGHSSMRSTMPTSRPRPRRPVLFASGGYVVSAAPPETIDRTAVLRLRPHVRLQFDETRQQWVVQAPERVLMPDEIAVRILKLCDGQTRVEAIAETFAGEYQAPRDVIEGDVLEMLRDPAEKGIVTHARG